MTQPPRRPRVVMAMSPGGLADHLFAGHHDELHRTAEVLGPVLSSFADDESRAHLARAEVLVTGWGCPPVTREVLGAAPRLRGLLHTGGATAGFIDLDAARERGLFVSHAADANAIPVAEYTFAQILLANKRVRAAEELYRLRRDRIDRETDLLDTGNYRRTVGLVGASRIGRRVARLLRGSDLTVLMYDPYLAPAQATSLGVALCGLHDLMRRSDVVSLHVPVTAETAGMIDAAALAAMPDGATLINTARGAVVDHAALLAELRTGRIDAVLDVTEPEPLPPGHPLWDLPNVVLTPHVAGSTGTELARLGRTVLDELARYVSDRPLHHAELTPAGAVHDAG
ncbi:hydroxyacid dehydrogenase [Kineosporia sp. J2-2]|uniref:Hydroxyacid dehydrogenase n=1 Tax=Kineosporia corallincola TaxID=2835133 RepID=A0ABS5TRR8_9ACTN|nr:hydroxyacid dehydrogenase [Kineosporia corallincola]MBT0773497.1 hydroxyacid dehydrogenase [Kineosporia corallincola]